VETNLRRFIFVLLLEIQLSRGEGCDPINWFNPACPKPGPGFPTSYVVFFMFNELREVIVRFVNNGEIVDHHCLNFLSVMVKY
jgi:hypothetical protein